MSTDQPAEPSGPRSREADSRGGRLSRRHFLPLVAGASALGMGALAKKAFATPVPDGDQDGKKLRLRFDVDFEYRSESDPNVRHGLGVVVVGASSGMGAEIARQYAEHGAFVVLAARRRDRLEQVADEVVARGGKALVVVTDVRDESQGTALIEQSIDWLGSMGKGIDLLVLASARVQASTFGPHLSPAVFRNVLETNFLGLSNCLRTAIPHLRERRSTVFYFNSIASTVGFPTDVAYTASAHAWQAMRHVVKAESPQIRFVCSQFAGVDSESWEKELTCFDDDQRYCPSATRSYLGIPDTHANWYPVPFAVTRAVQAIERGSDYAFLSQLNQATWRVGSMRQDLGWYLVVLESLAGFEAVQAAERTVASWLENAASVKELAERLSAEPSSELGETARLLALSDLEVALFLLGLEELLPDSVQDGARELAAAHDASFQDGSYEQLLIALSSGTLSPPGIADDGDGLAEISDCPPAGI